MPDVYPVDPSTTNGQGLSIHNVLATQAERVVARAELDARDVCEAHDLAVVARA